MKNLGNAAAVTIMNNTVRKYARGLTKKMEQIENEVHQAMAVMDEETGQLLNYRQLLHSTKYKNNGAYHQLTNSDGSPMASATESRIPPTQSNSYAKKKSLKIAGKTSHMDHACAACDPKRRKRTEQDSQWAATA